MDASLLELTAIPVISAVTGYVTNTIAVRMLFRPRRPRRLVGWSLQGLIPKRRSQIAHSIGETVERHLISHDDIRRVMAKPEIQARIREGFGARVDYILQNKMSDLHPMAAMFLNDQMLAKIKVLIMEEIEKAMGPVTENLMEALEEELDFRQTVIDKIEQFDLDRFEEIILSIARRELRSIEILGGVLGFFIGLVTVLILIF